MPVPIPDDRLLAMLREDEPYGDAATLALGLSDRSGRAVFRTRATITLVCIEEAERMMQLAGCRETRRLASSGSQVEAGGDLLVAEGDAAALHRAFRGVQALVEVASGVATRARRILLAARQGRPGIAVACARKPLPGAKDVMLKAIMAGGCVPHRFGLSGTLLVFAQHRAFLGRQPPRFFVMPNGPFGWVAGPPSVQRPLGLRWLLSVLRPEVLPSAAMRAKAAGLLGLMFGIAVDDAALARLLGAG
ncbi:MAG: hypothetical protein IRZ13_04265 [Acetobacteraceae bacterium]|nr:hypothetical protein [Acetobacteraceae bacterium]